LYSEFSSAKVRLTRLSQPVDGGSSGAKIKEYALNQPLAGLFYLAGGFLFSLKRLK
jgi:hypothetical protein